MGDSNLHSLSEKDVKVDCWSTLPDEMLVKIFLELSLHDHVRLNLVCKRWYLVSRSDVVWEKFLPKYPGIRLPDADTLQGIFQKLWENSIKIGKERWFPNALPDLVEYDTALRMEEMKEIGKELESKCVLYLHLNPLYPFTTNGLNTKDPAMVQIVQSIFDEFGNIDEEHPHRLCGVDFEYDFICDGRSVMVNSYYTKKKNSIDVIVYCLESQNFLEFKKNPFRDCPLFDEEGYRVKNISSQDQNQVDNAEQKSDEESRLNENLLHKIRTMLFGKSCRFVKYYLNQACYQTSSVCPYTRHLIVGDTSAVYCVQFHYYDDDLYY